MSTANRSLDAQEIGKIIAADKAAKATDSAKKALEWPGEENVERLARAVSDRKQIVEFETGATFTIRYDDVQKVVFIRPIDEDSFVPCGYFEYDTLKGVIA